MQKRETRVSKFAHDDGWLVDRCREYLTRNAQPPEFAQEIYDIIDANLAQFRIALIHGSTICEELRQDCALVIFRYTIGKMLSTASATGKINAHSYIYQSAYFRVLQFVNKKRREWKRKVDIEVLNEILGQMVYADGQKTVAKDISEEERFYEKVGNA